MDIVGINTGTNPLELFTNWPPASSPIPDQKTLYTDDYEALLSGQGARLLSHLIQIYVKC